MKKGVWTALITPFCEDGSLDIKGLEKNIEMQKQAQVAGLVALGTTGESPTLTASEKKIVITTCVNSGMDVIVGTGSNCTSTTIRQTKEAADLGAKGALVISPYYNRPTEKGLMLHFTTLAEESPIPIILYDHPGRTGVSLGIKLRHELAGLQGIYAIKDATGMIGVMNETLSFMRVYSGDDTLAWNLKMLGGEGVISVVSNLLPALMVDLWNGQESAQQKLKPFFAASTMESNPICIKAMMRLSGLPAGPCRLPLCNPTEETTHYLEKLCSQETLTLHR